MQLKRIPTRDSDGQLDINVCITDGFVDHCESEKVICDFGSVYSGDLAKLIQFTNSVHQYLLRLSVKKQVNLAVNARSYGTVYVISQLLELFDLKMEWCEDNIEVNTSLSLSSLPTLIAALLDPDFKKTDRPEKLSQRLYCERSMVFTSQSIRNLLVLAAEKISLPQTSRKSMTVADRHRREKLTAWITSDWGEPLNPLEQKGFETVISLSQQVAKWIESHTDSSWNTIVEHLRELRAIQIEHLNNVVYLSTRMTSVQTGIFYRLKVPYPPLVFQGLVPEQSSQITTKLEDDMDWESISLQFHQV